MSWREKDKHCDLTRLGSIGKQNKGKRVLNEDLRIQNWEHQAMGGMMGGEKMISLKWLKDNERESWQ